MGFSSALKRNWKGIGIGIDKKELELELLFFIPKELELELELNVKELELELNWKKGIDPSPVKYPHNETKLDCDICGIPGVISNVRVSKFDTFEPLAMFLGVSDAFCWLSNISIFDQLLNFD